MPKKRFFDLDTGQANFHKPGHFSKGFLSDSEKSQLIDGIR
jgi:hypothetical protein